MHLSIVRRHLLLATLLSGLTLCSIAQHTRNQQRPPVGTNSQVSTRSNPAGPAPAATRPARPHHLSDSALLELVEHQTFRYFWDFAHPVSGMGRERSNRSYDYGN